MTPGTRDVAGPLVPPGDARYPTLVRGFNLRWVGAPAYVEVVRDAGEVVDALRRALDAGLRVTVRGGGHCYEDFVSGNDGGVIVDLSPMHAVYRDGASDRYVVEGGATLWNVYGELYRRYGVTLPGGSCYSVGAGGHVSGGGYGLLSRKHGLVVDYLDAVEIACVDASGEVKLVTVERGSTATDEADLLWANQGGGGGNFGIVTKFVFRDPPPAPAEALLLTLAWDWAGLTEDAFARLVGNYGEFLAANSDVDSPYDGLFALLHLTQRAPHPQPSTQVVLTAQYVGRRTELLRDFARAVCDGLPPAVGQRAPVGWHHFALPTTDVRALPWLFATQTLNGSGPNRRGKYKSAYMKRPFPASQVEAMWRHLADARVPNTQALLQVDSYGCRVNAVAPDATAIPQRSSIMKLQYQTYWTDSTQDSENLEWIRAFYRDMYGERGPYPDDVVDGCYVNYPDVDLEDWQYLYYKDAYARLQRVKRRWDPNDVFNHAQSIELPSDA